jgi:S-(hydroxymethyl)glutathione dehydrogenase / alcohol dehydrogenase
MIVTKGAVWDGSRLFVTHDLEVREPGPDEVTVRVLASGICHSDLNVIDGTSPVPPPVVLGHEAAGTVELMGDEVTSVRLGEAVVVGSTIPCEACRACQDGRPGECRNPFGQGQSRFLWQGRPVRAFANVSSWSSMITVKESQIVACPGIPPKSAALIGCAVSTGFGVVRNVARVKPGDVVVVLGVGGIGVNVVQTARLFGASLVVAADIDAAKEDAALRFGADAFVAVESRASAERTAERIRKRTGADIDVVVECSGNLTAIDTAIRCTAAGGLTALVGIPPAGTMESLDVNDLLRNRTVAGSLNGKVELQRDFPTIIGHIAEGGLEIDSQVSKVWPLAEIDSAIAAVRAGSVIRAVLDHGD